MNRLSTGWIPFDLLDTRKRRRGPGGATTVNGEVAQLVLLLAVLLVLVPLLEESAELLVVESVDLAEPLFLLSPEELEPVRAELFVVALPLSVR